MPRLVARELPQPRPNADAAISKTSACGEMLSATPHQLQSKVCNVDCAPMPLNCMGKPQNGQWGCGASVSMRPTRRPRRLTES